MRDPGVLPVLDVVGAYAQRDDFFGPRGVRRKGWENLRLQSGPGTGNPVLSGYTEQTAVSFFGIRT